MFVGSATENLCTEAVWGKVGEMAMTRRGETKAPCPLSGATASRHSVPPGGRISFGEKNTFEGIVCIVFAL